MYDTLTTDPSFRIRPNAEGFNSDITVELTDRSNISIRQDSDTILLDLNALKKLARLSQKFFKEMDK